MNRTYDLPEESEMDRGIRITRIWSDNDMVQLQVEVSDGTSHFTNCMYVGFADFAGTIEKLDRFKYAVHGGLVDVRFGELGCEYAGGAFHARFHFSEPGGLLISSRQESDFTPFGKQSVASNATLYIRSEPALLDRFIEELKGIGEDSDGEAFLEAV